MLSSFVMAMFSVGEPLLAQTAKKGLSDQDRSEIFFWLIVLIILAVIGSVAGFIVYRKMKKADEVTAIEQDFSLSQMRRLYEAGEISHDEFMQVRERILAASRKAMLGVRDAMPRMAPMEAKTQEDMETQADVAVHGEHDEPMTSEESPQSEVLPQDDKRPGEVS